MSRTVFPQGFKLYLDRREPHPDEGRRIVTGFDNPPRVRQEAVGCLLFITLWGTAFSDLQNFPCSKNTSGDKISTLPRCPLYSPALVPINISMSTCYFHASYRTVAAGLIYTRVCTEHSKEVVPREWIIILAQVNVRQGRIICGMIAWDDDERHEFWVLGWSHTPFKTF